MTGASLTPLAAMPVKSVRLDNGLQFHYADTGGGAPALVFVHGGAGEILSSAGQWPDFASRFRLIAYSRRYSQPNDNPLPGPDAPPHDPTEEVRDLQSLLGHWGVESAVFVASSYGALITLMLALESPQMVRAMVLVEPALTPWARMTERGRMLLAENERDVRAPAREAFLRGDDVQATAVLSAGILGQQVLTQGSPEQMAVRLRNARAMRVLTLSERASPDLDPQRVQALSMPTLLVTGARTQPLMREVFLRVVEQMPDADKIVIPAAGHTVTRDQPQAFNRAALEFLERRGLAEAA